MDENRITGTARNLGGKVEEGVGRVTGDAKTQVRGMADEAAGAAQDLYGKARDTAADAAFGDLCLTSFDVHSSFVAHHKYLLRLRPSMLSAYEQIVSGR